MGIRSLVTAHWLLVFRILVRLDILYSPAMGDSEQALKDFGRILTELHDFVKREATEADRYVRENPWNAAGIAVVAGFVLGVLASRRAGDHVES